MKEARRLLLWLFWIPVLLAALIVLLYETGALAEGDLTDAPQLEFLVTMTMELLTIAAIPSAMRLFKWRPVAARIASRREKALARWGSVRLLMLTLPMVANTLFYYLFVNTTFGYMALILLLCLAFVYPTVDKCTYEIAQHVNSVEEETDGRHR